MMQYCLCILHICTVYCYNVCVYVYEQGAYVYVKAECTNRVVY